LCGKILYIEIFKTLKLCFADDHETNENIYKSSVWTTISPQFCAILL